MPYVLLLTYALCYAIPRPPTWWTDGGYAFIRGYRLCVIRGMPYEGFDCIGIHHYHRNSIRKLPVKRSWNAEACFGDLSFVTRSTNGLLQAASYIRPKIAKPSTPRYGGYILWRIRLENQACPTTSKITIFRHSHTQCDEYTHPRVSGWSSSKMIFIVACSVSMTWGRVWYKFAMWTKALRSWSITAFDSRQAWACAVAFPPYDYKWLQHCLGINVSLNGRNLCSNVDKFGLRFLDGDIRVIWMGKFIIRIIWRFKIECYLVTNLTADHHLP